MAEDSEALYVFKKQLEQISKYQGRGTELISVYITPGYPISEIAGKLREEYGQASNIKSASTKKNVQSALDKVLSFLKVFQKTPQNGMAIFAGNVSEVEGKTDVQLFSIEPPFALHTQFYRCESKFVIEPLKEILESTGTYGLVVMDGKEATIATLKAKDIKVLKKLNSTAMQKTSKGGQSSARYGRIHDETVEAYYKRIGSAMDAFLDLKNFEGVIVGGPGPSKEDFMRLKPFNYQFKILGVVDTGYTDEYGLREILEKSGDIIAGQELIKEKKIVDEFMSEAFKEGLATYGYSEIKKAIQDKSAGRILLSESLKDKFMSVECNDGSKREVLTQEEAEKSCPTGIKKEDLKNIFDEILEEAHATGIPVDIISTTTAEGQQFQATFHGLGATLKYKKRF